MVIIYKMLSTKDPDSLVNCDGGLGRKKNADHGGNCLQKVERKEKQVKKCEKGKKGAKKKKRKEKKLSRKRKHR